MIWSAIAVLQFGAEENHVNAKEIKQEYVSQSQVLIYVLKINIQLNVSTIKVAFFRLYISR
jgi:hypothetical protein